MVTESAQLRSFVAQPELPAAKTPVAASASEKTNADRRDRFIGLLSKSLQRTLREPEEVNGFPKRKEMQRGLKVL